MKPEFEMVYESTPEDGPRSRLEPYRELILRWRRQGRTYRRIQKLLVEKFAVQTSTTTLFKFVKSRSKPRKPKTDSALDQAILEAAQPKLPEQPATPRTATNLSPGATQQRVSLASFRNKPALEPRPPVLQEFHYDESKPLTIDRTIKD